MAAPANKQGITKKLSGANATFNDKVHAAQFELHQAEMACRASRWNCGYRTWSQQRVCPNDAFCNQGPRQDSFSVSDQRCRADLTGPKRNGQDGVYLRMHLEFALIDSSDVQIQTAKGEVIITNDGATILKSIQALHPAAKMACPCILPDLRRNDLFAACRPVCGARC